MEFPAGLAMAVTVNVASRAIKVWIDQDLCTAAKPLETIEPAVFTLLDDGLAYVGESDLVRNEWISKMTTPRWLGSAPASAS